ncbi:MAG: methyl-accepting chemotaxis protein [Thermoguttaceae bacterium]
MKLSSFKLTSQFIIVLGGLTLLICGVFTGFTIKNLRLVIESANGGLSTLNSQQEKASNELDSSIKENISAIQTETDIIVVEQSLKELENLSAGIAGRISTVFDSALSASRTFAGSIEGYMAHLPLEERQRSIPIELAQGVQNINPEFLGIWFGFEQNKFDGKDSNFENHVESGCDSTGRFIPWISEKNSQISVEPLIGPDTSKYYSVTMQTGNESITDPFEYEGIQLISMSVPINNSIKERIGVAGVDVPVTVLDSILNEQKPYGDGFVYVVSETGRIVWHPDSNLIGKELHAISGTESFAQAIKDNEKVRVLTDSKDHGEIYQVLLPRRFGKVAQPWGIVVCAKKTSVLESASAVKKALSKMETDFNNQISTTKTTMCDLSDTVRSDFDSKGKSAIQFAIQIGVIILVTNLVIAIYAGRSFAAPIGRAAKAMGYIADTGDVAFAVNNEDMNRKDEVGLMTRAFEQMLNEFRYIAELASKLEEGVWDCHVEIKGENDSVNKSLSSMVASINATLNSVREIVGVVETGAAQISLASHQVSSGSTQSASSVEQISAVMVGLNENMQKNMEATSHATSAVKDANDVASNGQGLMKELLHSMTEITKTSATVKQVVKMIDDIAFQTNLLALNAAVEAARAGQHGKGFAVVAEEVRNLAARSAKAAHETADLIDQSNRQISEGAKLAEKTGAVLDRIVVSQQEVSQVVDDITRNNKEQAEGVSQVVHGVRQIEDVTQKNAAGAEETSAESKSLSYQASKLHELVGQFKLRDKSNY